MSLQTWGIPLISSQADGSALTAAAAASMLPAQAKFTLPANFLNNVGMQLLVKASGRISTVITTPGTARFDVRFGGTVVFDSQAIALDTNAAYTNVGWTLEVLLTVRASGSSGNLFGQGIWACTQIAGTPQTPPKGALVAILPWNQAPAVGGNADFTVSQQVDVFFTQTVATGSLTCHQYSLLALPY